MCLERMCPTNQLAELSYRKAVCVFDKIRPCNCMGRSERFCLCVDDKPVERLSTFVPVSQ